MSVSVVASPGFEPTEILLIMIWFKVRDLQSMKSRLEECRNEEGDWAVLRYIILFDRAAVALARRGRLTLRNTHTSEPTIRRRAEWLQ